MNKGIIFADCSKHYGGQVCNCITRFESLNAPAAPPNPTPLSEDGKDEFKGW